MIFVVIILFFFFNLRLVVSYLFVGFFLDNSLCTFYRHLKYVIKFQTFVQLTIFPTLFVAYDLLHGCVAVGCLIIQQLCDGGFRAIFHAKSGTYRKQAKWNGQTHTYICTYIQLNELDNSDGGVQNGEWGGKRKSRGSRGIQTARTNIVVHWH